MNLKSGQATKTGDAIRFEALKIKQFVIGGNTENISGSDDIFHEFMKTVLWSFLTIRSKVGNEYFQLYFVFAIFYMLSACSFHRYLPPAAFRQLSALALMPSNMKSARSMACGWSLHLKCLFFLCP